MLSPRAAARSRSAPSGGGSRNRLDPHPPSGAGFTLVEVILALAIAVLAATLVVPRLGGLGDVRLEGAARRFAEAVRLARERAILGGAPGVLVVDSVSGRWTAGDESALLPAGVQFAGLRDIVQLELDPAADSELQFVLVDDRGRRASVVLPAGGGANVMVIAP